MYPPGYSMHIANGDAEATNDDEQLRSLMSYSGGSYVLDEILQRAAMPGGGFGTRFHML